jgi:hypothetical protein
MLPHRAALDPRWAADIAALVQGQPQVLLREAYFNAVVELKNRQFSDALVKVSQFQEMALRFLVAQQLGGSPALPKTYGETADFWQRLALEYGDLYRFLEGYQFRGQPLALNGFLNRPKLLAILEYAPPAAIAPLETLNTYCQQRNQYIHEFGGISELEGADDLLRAMRQVLEHLGQSDFSNPFNALNQEILALLEESRQT